MAEWVADNVGGVFRFLTYRRMFTPYEIEQKFMDESQFEDIHYDFGILQEAVDLGGGEWMLVFRGLCDYEETGQLIYRRLSEIQFCRYPEDDREYLRTIQELSEKI